MAVVSNFSRERGNHCAPALGGSNPLSSTIYRLLRTIIKNDFSLLSTRNGEVLQAEVFQTLLHLHLFFGILNKNFNRQVIEKVQFLREYLQAFSLS